MISFKVQESEQARVDAIIERAVRIEPDLNRLELNMDLCATHANGCPLDFERLLNAPMADFFHDIGGIRQHINRANGHLEDCFVPRCAQPEEVAQ